MAFTFEQAKLTNPYITDYKPVNFNPITFEQAKLTNPYITDYKPVNFNPIRNPISPYRANNNFNPINTTNYEIANQIAKADQEGRAKLIDGGKGVGDQIVRTLQNQQNEVKRQSDQFDANRKYEDQQRQANHNFIMRNPGFNSGIGTTDIRDVFGGDKNTTFTYSNPQLNPLVQPKPKGLESSINSFNKIVNSDSINPNSQPVLLQPEPKQTQTAPNQEISTSQLSGVDLLANQNNKPKNYFDTDYFSR